MTTETQQANGAAKAGGFAVILLGIVASLQMIDPAVANVAIVEAGRDLQFNAVERALAASISTLALAASVLASGIMADRLGRRRILVVAIILAIVGDLLAAATPVTAGYLLGRALAGIGVGAALAATFAYVRFVSPPDKVGQSLGIWNAVMLVTMLPAVVVGGALAGQNWRLALLLVPVLGLILIPLVLRVLPPMPKTGTGPVDIGGLAVIGGSMVLLLYGISNAAASLTGPLTIGPVVAGLLGFALFAFIEARQGDRAAFPIRLFLQGVFVAAVLAGITWNLAQAVVQLQTSNFWQYVQRLDTLAVSLAQMPFLAVVAVLSLVAGTLLSAKRLGLATALALGYAAMVAGFVALAFVRADSPYWVFLPGLLLVGAGLSLVAVPQSVMFVSQAPAAFYGAVTSFRTTVGQLGYAIGLAAGVVLVQTLGQIDLVKRLEAAGVPPANVGAAIDQILLFIHSGAPAETAEAQQAIAGVAVAYTTGFASTMLVTAVLLAVIGALVVFLMVRASRTRAA